MICEVIDDGGADSVELWRRWSKIEGIEDDEDLSMDWKKLVAEERW